MEGDNGDNGGSVIQLAANADGGQTVALAVNADGGGSVPQNAATEDGVKNLAQADARNAAAT